MMAYKPKVSKCDNEKSCDGEKENIRWSLEDEKHMIK